MSLFRVSAKPETLLQCIVCGCLWRDGEDMISLAYPSQGCGTECCDNVPDVGQYRVVVLSPSYDLDVPKGV